MAEQELFRLGLLLFETLSERLISAAGLTVDRDNCYVLSW